MGEIQTPLHYWVTEPLASPDPFRVGVIDKIIQKIEYGRPEDTLTVATLLLCFVWAVVICAALVGGPILYEIDLGRGGGIKVTEFSGRLVDREPSYTIYDGDTYLVTSKRGNDKVWKRASVLDLRGFEKNGNAMGNGLYRDVRFSVWKAREGRNYNNLRCRGPVYVLFTDPEGWKDEE